MKEKINIANTVTFSRILFAVFVLFSDTFSVQFYTFYLLGAFTDMIDGTIARKLNLKSSFGSKLDSVADFIFVTAVFVKICCALYVPGWIWTWIAIIAFIKSYIKPYYVSQIGFDAYGYEQDYRNSAVFIASDYLQSFMAGNRNDYNCNRLNCNICGYTGRRLYQDTKRNRMTNSIIDYIN